MKVFFKKLLVIVLITIIITNFLMTNSYAAGIADAGDAVLDGIMFLLGSFIGLLTYPVRLIAMGAAWAVNVLTASVAYIEGTTEGAVASTGERINIAILTPYDIFFNRVKILDVNFFDIGNDKSLVTQIRTSVAAWFYVLRNVAAIILLVIFIYVGIRMALSTVASEKALYKKMLVDWVSSLALIFLIQYIIIFTVTVNSSLLQSIELGVNSEEIANTFGKIWELALDPANINSISATVIFCMLVWQTLGLLISYFNRMLKIAFLIIISPLITLTYSIDKMGDGKAQALGAWLKEFIYTILIQPFHCIIYMSFIGVAYNLLLENIKNGEDNNILGVAIVSIVCIHFTKEAEKLIRKIFSFKDDNSSTAMSAGLAIAGGALVASKSIGKSAKSAVNGAKYTKGAFQQAFKGAKVGTLALAAKAKDPSKSLAEHKSDVRTNINTKQADKIASKQRYKAHIKSEAVEKEKAAIMAAAPGIAEKEAESIARLNVAKRVRNERGAVRKHITKARGKVNKLRTAISHSESLKTISAIGKTYVSTGLGLMVGSGIYGTEGNMGTAIAGGMAMASAAQEFQRTSGTLETQTEDHLVGLGVTSAAGAAAEFNFIFSNSQLFDGGDESNEELKKLLDKLGDALEQAGIDPKIKTNIQNKIQSGIKANPARSQQIVREALNGLQYQGNKDPLDPNAGKETLTGVSNLPNREPLTDVNNGEVLQATQDLADFINRREIYQQIQTAGNFNIDADTYCGDIISRLEDRGPDYSEEIVEKGAEEVKDATEFKTNKQEVDDQTSALSNGQLEALDMEYEKMKEEYRRQGKDPKLSTQDKQAIDNAIHKLEQEQADIISRALADADRDLTTINKSLIEKYEKKLADALAEAEADFQQQSQQIAQQQRLQQSATVKKNRYNVKQSQKVAFDLATAKRDRLQETTSMWRQNISNN